MPDPDSTNVIDLMGKGEDGYAEWLRRGLHDYLYGTAKLKPQSPYAFVDAEPFININGSLAEDLAAIYRALPDGDRIDFAKGCARALAGLDLDEVMHAGMAEELIRLAANIRAYPVLRKLAAMAPRSQHLPGAERLLDFTLTLIGELADPAYDEAADCVMNIVAHCNPFPAERSRGALLALVAADPNHLVDHLHLLYTPLEVCYGMHAGNSTSGMFELRQGLILEVAQLVLKVDVLKETARFSRWRPDEMAATDGMLDWWVMTLLVPDNENAEWKRLRRRLGLSMSASVSLLEPEPVIVGDESFDIEMIADDWSFDGEEEDVVVPKWDAEIPPDADAIINHPGLHEMV